MGSTIVPGYGIPSIIREFGDDATGGAPGIYQTPSHAATVPGIVELWFLARESAMKDPGDPRLCVVRCERYQGEWDFKVMGVNCGPTYYGAPWEMVKEDLERIEAQGAKSYALGWLAKWQDKNGIVGDRMRKEQAQVREIAVGPRVAAL